MKLIWWREKSDAGRVQWSLRRANGFEEATVRLHDTGKHRSFRASWHHNGGWWVQTGSMASAKAALERWVHRKSIGLFADDVTFEEAV